MISRNFILQVPKLEDNIRVKARMTFTQTFISAISYSKPMPKNLALDKKDFVENEAINVGFQFHGKKKFVKLEITDYSKKKN